MKRIIVYILIFIRLEGISQDSVVELIGQLNGWVDKHFIEMGSRINTKNNKFFSLSFGYGNYGHTELTGNDISGNFIVNNFRTPYDWADTSGYSYRNTEYRPNNIGFSLGGEVGNYWEVIRGKGCILGALGYRYYWITDYSEFVYTHNVDENETYLETKQFSHNTHSFSMKCMYKQNITKAISIEGGIAIPFYFPVFSDVYNPFDGNNLMMGAEPNLSFGISYKIL